MSFPPELVDIVRQNSTLCLNVENPGYEDSRNYAFHEPTATLYFHVATKYLPARPEGYRVLIWSQPRVVATGVLHLATSEADVALRRSLTIESGANPEDVDRMLLDQRNKKPRKALHKLFVNKLELAS